MLRCLHIIHRKDQLINTLYTSIAKDMAQISNLLDEDYNNIFFRQCTPAGAKIFERDLGCDNSGLDIIIRRKIIENLWRAKRFSSVPIIQDIADSFYTDKMSVDFIGGKIVYKMSVNLSNLNNFITSVNKIKPAHLGYKFVYHSETTTDAYVGVIVKSRQKTKINIATDLTEIKQQNVKLAAVCAIKKYNKIIIRSGD